MGAAPAPDKLFHPSSSWREKGERIKNRGFQPAFLLRPQMPTSFLAAITMSSSFTVLRPAC